MSACLPVCLTPYSKPRTMTDYFCLSACTLCRAGHDDTASVCLVPSLSRSVTHCLCISACLPVCLPSSLSVISLSSRQSPKAASHETTWLSFASPSVPRSRSYLSLYPLLLFPLPLRVRVSLSVSACLSPITHPILYFVYFLPCPIWEIFPWCRNFVSLPEKRADCEIVALSCLSNSQGW